MDLQDYEVVKTTWINGRRALPGAMVKISERAARYHLLDGALKPVSKAVQKPAEGPRKRARKSDDPAAETAEG